VLAAIRQNGHVSGHDDLIAEFSDVHDLLGMEEVRELERQFLPPSVLRSKYGVDGDNR
jgi:hypothetical protein